MRDQTAREPNFPVACARCGGRISEPVAFCPHCGAHARFALAGSSGHAGSLGQAPRGSAASARVEPTVPSYDFKGDLDPPWPGPPTPLFASPDGDPYGEVRAPNGRGWGLKAGTIAVVAAFVVVYAGVVAFHRFDGASLLSPSGSSKSVEGTIGSTGGNVGNLAARSDRDARSSNNAMQPTAPVVDDASPAPAPRDESSQLSGAADKGVSSNGAMRNGASIDAAPRVDESTPPDTSIALPPRAQPSLTVAPPPQPNVAPAQQSQAPQPQTQLQPNGANDSYGNARARGYASRSAQASPSGGQVANAQRQYRSQRSEAQSGRAAASRALSSAQALLWKSDLRGARASLDKALAADPTNGEALGLREELVSREQERDASLSAAHACVVQERWTCVWHNAGKALAADSSSTEARALVDRAIVESGAATAPAGPGPDNVQVPMPQ